MGRFVGLEDGDFVGASVLTIGAFVGASVLTTGALVGLDVGNAVGVGRTGDKDGAFVVGEGGEGVPSFPPPHAQQTSFAVLPFFHCHAP